MRQPMDGHTPCMCVSSLKVSPRKVPCSNEQTSDGSRQANEEELALSSDKHPRCVTDRTTPLGIVLGYSTLPPALYLATHSGINFTYWNAERLARGTSTDYSLLL